MMHNPYYFNQPARPEDFVGRWSLVERIVADLSYPPQANSWALIGGRRFGKASVLRALHSRLSGASGRSDEGRCRVLPVIANLQRCETQSERNLYLCILREMHRELGQNADIAPELPTTELRAVVSGKSEECSFYQFEEVLVELSRLLEQHWGPVRIGLLLDEVEKVMRFSWRDAFFDKMRALVYDGYLVDTVKLVLTGSTGVAQARASGSPLLTSVNVEHLRVLSATDVEELVGRSGEVSPEISAAIQEQSGGHPYITQCLLQKLWDGGLSGATPAHVEATARQVRQERAAELQSWWDDIGDMGQRAYSLLSTDSGWHHERALLERIHDPLLPLDQALAALCYHGLSVRDESGQYYRVAGTLFRDWVMQNKSASAVQLENRVGLAPTRSSKVITWLHLSDVHFRESTAEDRDVVLGTFLRDVTTMMEGDGLRPDFIVLTGDLAFSGKSVEYILARRFLDELLSTTSLTKDRLFVVPGNHDVDRSLVSAGAKLIGASLTDRANVNYVLGSAADRRLLLDRFKWYGEFINDYFAGHLTFSDENYFYVRMLDLAGRRIALLGLNSSWLAESDEDEARKLVVGDKQTRGALKGARNAKADLKLALLHHPFSWLREFDQGDSIAMLLDECDFVLHGHLHHTGLTQLRSPDGAAVVIAGGACYETRKYPNSLNFVRLDLTTNTGTIYLWRYSDERGGFWVRDNSLYKNTPDGVYRFKFLEKGNSIST